MGQGEVPGSGRGAKVSWSEAPLEPSLSFRDRLAMSGWKVREKRRRVEETFTIEAFICRINMFLKD